MELKSFVAQSLVQIVEGVVEASSQVAALGGAVSPSYATSSSSSHIGTSRGDQKPVHAVEFDVALIVNAHSASDGVEKLSVSSVGSQQEGCQASLTNESTSRLRFVVPLQLPTDSNSQASADKAAEEERRERDATAAKIRNHNSRDGWMAT